MMNRIPAVRGVRYCDRASERRFIFCYFDHTTDTLARSRDQFKCEFTAAFLVDYNLRNSERTPALKEDLILLTKARRTCTRRIYVSNVCAGLSVDLRQVERFAFSCVRIQNLRRGLGRGCR